MAPDPDSGKVEMSDLSLVLRIESEKSKFQFSRNEIREIEQNYSVAIHTFPESVEEEEGQRQHAYESLTMLLFFGAGITFVCAKIFEGFLKEIGSDAYKGIKRRIVEHQNKANKPDIIELVSALMARNQANSYTLYQTVMIGCTINEQHVFIKLLINTRDLIENQKFQDANKKYIEHMAALNRDYFLDQAIQCRNEYTKDLLPVFSDIVKLQLADLYKDWDTIVSDIQTFQIGIPGGIGWSESGLHVIEKQKGDDKWIIKALTRRRPSNFTESQ